VKRFAGGDDARPEEEHPMKAKREQQSPPEDMERFREQLSLKIQRLVAESLEAWSTCDNLRCRRDRRCASRNRECIAKSQQSPSPLSPEEAQARLRDFKIELEVRIRLSGQSVTAEQLTEAIRKEQAARRAAMPPPDDEPLPAVAEETQLSPEKQERINRAWNNYVASLPAQGAETAEDADERRREPGPRITQL
jgi:hypothetical protein